ncbi:hypothetical protein NQZ68_041641 [Dissostichus eleginoides]|nr:hypothetical protein NQZ68_041641 [Dissostichus eleginoides]
MITVGVEDVEDLPLVKELDVKHLLTPIQCRKMLLAFRRKEDEQCPQQELPTPLPSTSTALTPPQPRATDSQSITLTLTSVDLALLHPNAWAENFCLPWEKLNAKLRLAVSKEERPEGTDRRHLVKVVVNSIQENCTNPTRSQCAEVAKAIIRKYPKSFADLTEEGGYMGCGYITLLTQIKTRVEHVNRNNTMARLHKTKRKTMDDQDNQESHSSVKIDSYGCVNWQPQECSEGETLQSLEEKRQLMVGIFNEEGPRGAQRGCVGDNMEDTYILQRHHINENPPPAVAVLDEKWPFLFTKELLCSHFSKLTGIHLHERLSGALQTKGKRIINFFNSQRTKWRREIQDLLSQIEEDSSNQDLCAILIMMAHFKEKEEALFLLADDEIEAPLTLPGTPRLIMLGRVICTLPNQANFMDAFTVFFGFFFVLNIQYQEEASTILEFIQRQVLNSR